MRILIFLIVALNLISSDFKFKTDLNLYSESYDIDYTKLNLTSLFAKIDLNQYNSGDDGKLRLTTTGNFILEKKDEYDLYKLNDAKAIVSNASYEYIFENLALSVGRNKIDYPLLKGSFDGGLGYWIHESFSGKFFAFNSYETLYPAYYKRYKDINLFGGSLSYKDRKTDGTLYLFQDKNRGRVSSLTGYKLLPQNFEIGFDGIHYDSDTNSSESLYKVYGGYVSSNFNIQGGIIQNSNAELDNIYKYGKSRINQFGLGNMLYLPNSQNYFLSGKYRTKDLFTQLIVGETTYETQTYKNLRSKEMNFSVLYRFNKHYKIYGSYIVQKVDKLDDIYSDISLATITFNMRFR